MTTSLSPVPSAAAAAAAAVADAAPAPSLTLRARADALGAAFAVRGDFADHASQVAPTLAVLVGQWAAVADADARARWIEPLLPLLLDTAPDELAPDVRLAREARRAEHAAVGVVPLVGVVREVASGLDGMLAALRRRSQSAAGSLVQRFDTFTATLASTELVPQAVSRQARLARAAAAIATRPTPQDAIDQRTVQERALGAPLALHPEGAPPPPDATAAWRAAWNAADPRAGAACLAAAHAGQVLALAIRTPDVNPEGAHAVMARAVIRMAVEGRDRAEREALAAHVDGVLPDEFVQRVEGPATPARESIVLPPLDDAPATADVAPPSVRPSHRAAAARYDAERAQVLLTLASGATVGIPASLVPALAGAPVEALDAVQVGDDGTVLHWPALRLEVTVRGVLREALDLIG